MRYALAGLAVVAAAASAVLVPGTAEAVTKAPRSFTYKTKIQSVHVRSAPKTVTGSKIVSVIPHTGTQVKVTCYAVAAGKVWFKIVTPAGYVAGRNLNFKRPNGQKVPAGLPACKA
jgi:hypothetical protein